MSPERFQQIEELYHAAREATADERAGLMAQADPELRHEVEVLLSERKGGEFLDRPAIQHAFDSLEVSAVPMAEGARLGPYRIEHKLGEGGMGDVFRAVDTRLGRAVAIKITREQFGARFEREARAIAALNHPNICTIHDVGPNYLVMELVEGETLAARLKRGPLPVKTALLYASQIAAALAEAHAKDIVHRDLKPGNVMIARSGIKVLDFGLARSIQDQTVTASRTVMGTPGYMAPEQREGKPADARADIYSFGCVLYEVFTGATVAARRRLSLAETGSDREPMCGREPGAPVAVCRRFAARTRRRHRHQNAWHTRACRRRDAGVARHGVFLLQTRHETHR
jgi:eukaryotic-like serine/threonine-protein kinase